MGSPYLRLKHWILLAGIILIYLVIGSLTVFAQQPVGDEGPFASPAINFFREGHLGMSVKEVEGTRWTRMDERTFWQPPLYYLAQVAWYFYFGEGIFSMRFLSIHFGLIALLALFSIMEKITGSRATALLAVFLMAIDFVFIGEASHGRMDMMSEALALTGFACYVTYREKNLHYAILSGNTLVVLSGLTHPNGILAFIALTFMTIYLDRGRITPKYCLIAAIPYILGAIGWGVYIMQDPQAFIAQFGGNMSGRLPDSFSIIKSIRSEIFERYLFAYGIADGSAGIGKLRALILAAYVMGLIASIFAVRRSIDRWGRSILYLLGIYFLGLTFLIGNRSTHYIIYIMPFYLIPLATSISFYWQESRKFRLAIAAGIIILCCLQTGVNARRIQRNEYEKVYLPVVEQVKSLFDGSDYIMGPAAFGFAFDFQPYFVDDPTLGFYSGKVPDIIIIDAGYLRWFEIFGAVNPDKHKDTQRILEHVRNLLENEYSAEYANSDYTVYVRDSQNS